MCYEIICLFGCKFGKYVSFWGIFTRVSDMLGVKTLLNSEKLRYPLFFLSMSFIMEAISYLDASILTDLIQFSKSS